MVIDTNNINSSGSASGTRSRTTAPVTANDTKTSTPAPAETAVKSSKDNVVLSSEAQNMVRLQAKISNLPDVNLDRVAAIKQAIADGRFEINAERIAENMLKQDELLG
jgi:negative regulator of flagellin synthesis FlgM